MAMAGRVAIPSTDPAVMHGRIMQVNTAVRFAEHH
jgi:hypothetical protein